ncbi:COG3014 family protein [Psychromonas sp. Urea-02u-13]|uniref:COG3014 family protein n=1 Tax=Psychromonas sp. Urea-02u-13 TaxID=2058326 RepID=UPI000C34306F|nr:hypothetical protein [Psychromonas sp. Urea-02u-13]PKG38023.1 hypothetical protein CXF74_15810 [Psychromonas sp. Urea-02u-13]
MKKIITVFLIVLLSACAGQQRETNKLANQLQLQNPLHVLEQLQLTEPPERDYAQFHLNVGLLQLLSGDFPGSIETLTQAKKEMAVLTATSISENAAAGTVNETLRSYSGYPTDRVMVHNILALSYLFNDDIDGARVEMLQADISMRKLASKKSLEGQLASSHLLAGIIYELLDEQSNALISYKHAEELLTQRKLAIPKSLKKSLLRMSYAVDKNGQYSRYKKRYSGFPTPIKNNNNQVFSLYFDGVVSNKKQNSIMVPSGNGEQLIRIAMPAYPNMNYRITHAKLSDATQQFKTELIENVEVLVREDLSAEYPSILLLTTARAIAKYELVAQADKKDSLFGTLANLVTALTEIADLRSWNMLPSNIQVSYLETKDTELKIDSINAVQQKVALKVGSKNLLLISSLDTPVFHYAQ